MSPTRNPFSTRARFASPLTAMAVVAIAALVACSEPGPAASPFEPQFAAGGGGGPPVRVNATDPTGAEQETTLDVRVLGSNFEDGSAATFTLGGVAPSRVHTNSTTFVSSGELVANITIDVDADLGLYDVAVITPHGKKGVGTELFEVRVKGGGLPSAELSFSGALIADPSQQAVTQDNPQVLEMSLASFVVDVQLTATYANAVAEWAGHDPVNECTFELPPGKYDQEPVAQALIAKLQRPDWFPGAVQFYKPAILEGVESRDSYINGGGLGIGRANGGKYYGFLLVSMVDGDVNDATLPRVFKIEAGHGTIRSMVLVEGQKTKDAVANLRCRLQDQITVTVGPSS